MASVAGRASPPGTDGADLANPSMEPMEQPAEPAPARTDEASRTSIVAIALRRPIAKGLAARSGSARPLFSSAHRKVIIRSRAALVDRGRRRRARHRVAAAAHRTPAAAAEAITASRLSKRFFDFFPQARTSTSQRVRAIFLLFGSVGIEDTHPKKSPPSTTFREGWGRLTNAAKTNWQITC